MPMSAGREDRLLPRRAAGSGMNPGCRGALEGLYRDFMDIAASARDEATRWAAVGAAMGVVTAMNALRECEG